MTRNRHRNLTKAQMQEAIESVRVGTPDQAIWESVEKEAKVMIENLEKGLVVQKAILEMALKKIEEEKEKLIN